MRKGVFFDFVIHFNIQNLMFFFCCVVTHIIFVKWYPEDIPPSRFLVDDVINLRSISRSIHIRSNKGRTSPPRVNTMVSKEIRLFFSTGKVLPYPMREFIALESRNTSAV